MQRELLGEHRLAHASRPDKQERPDRPTGILQIRARTTQRTSHGHGRDVLADHGLLEFKLHREQLLIFLLLHPRERDARPVGDHLHHEVFVNGDPLLIAGFLPLFGDVFLLRAQLLLLIAELRRLFEVLFGNGLFLLSTDPLNFLREIFHIRRSDERTDARPGTGLIHDIDRFVREKTPGDIAVRELGRCFE